MKTDRSHIIAEAGVNHNGNISNAKKLIDIAKSSGADSVKFQIINPWGLYLKGDYKYGHYNIQDVIKNRFSTVLSDEDYTNLNKFARTKGIDFSASIFDENGLNLLSSFNPPYIKIASCDLTNIRLLRQVADKGHKMILSTGMSTLKEIESSLNILDKANFTDIVLLHCVSIYPCPPEKSNVNMIRVLKDEFNVEVGFSDHTRSSDSAIAAYALGARWFEKHFTFDNSLVGFDHKHAQNENEFQKYVHSIRMIETSMKYQDEKIDDKEKYTAQRARRSLYASRNMKKGDVIKTDDILCVRPSANMNANEIDLLIGARLLKDIKENKPFSKDIIE